MTNRNRILAFIPALSIATLFGAYGVAVTVAGDAPRTAQAAAVGVSYSPEDDIIWHGQPA